MNSERARRGRSGRKRGVLAALLLAALATAALQGAPAQLSTRPIEKRLDQKLELPVEAAPEGPVHLPPFPRGEDLVELDSGSFDHGVRVFLDPESLSQPAPGVVRYTMLLVSAKGTGNLFYESINCDRDRWRTLAFGTGEGTFEVMRDPRWRTLEAGASTGHRRVLAREFVCILGRRMPDRAEDLRRRLVQPSAMPRYGHAARISR